MVDQPGTAMTVRGATHTAAPESDHLTVHGEIKRPPTERITCPPSMWQDDTAMKRRPHSREQAVRRKVREGEYVARWSSPPHTRTAEGTEQPLRIFRLSTAAETSAQRRVLANLHAGIIPSRSSAQWI